MCPLWEDFFNRIDNIVHTEAFSKKSFPPTNNLKELCALCALCGDINF